MFRGGTATVVIIIILPIGAGQELLFPGLALRVYTLEKLISAIISAQAILSAVFV